MAAKAAKVMAAESIPEVDAFVKADSALNDFIRKHRDIYEQLEALVQQHNTLLESADKAVRAADVTCGPFIRMSESQKINAEKLYEELGDEAFKQVGGYTETIVDYKVDRERVLAEAVKGTIPEEVAEVCIRKEVRYKKPAAYVLP